MQRLFSPLARQLASGLRHLKPGSFRGIFQAVCNRTACSPIWQRGQLLCTSSAILNTKIFYSCGNRDPHSFSWKSQTNGWWHQYHISRTHMLYNRRLFNVTQTRGVSFGKKGKLKTVKAVAKRFIRTGSGKLKYWPAGKHHNMLAKSRKRRRQLRKARYANKTQLKTLNKMLSGW